jgi:hypothetical protein
VFKRVARIALLYLAWATSGVLALYAALQVWELVKSLYVALRLNPWGLAVVSNASIVLLGLAALAAIIYLEHWYGEALARGRLLRRFVQVTAVEVACALVAGGMALLL